MTQEKECKSDCQYCRGWEGICKYGQVEGDGERLCGDEDDEIEDDIEFEHIEDIEEIETDEDSDDSFPEAYQLANNYILML